MHHIRFEPAGLEIEIDPDTTLREAAHLLGLSVYDRCGGIGACCNCVITVLQGMDNLSPKNDLEAAVFYLDQNDRLSCQCRPIGPAIVQIPS